MGRFEHDLLHRSSHVFFIIMGASDWLDHIGMRNNGSTDYSWDVSLRDCLMITREPCIAIGIATCGRAHIVRAALLQLLTQAPLPQSVIVSYTKPEDIDGIAPDILGGTAVSFVLSPAGLPRQRNAILDLAQDCGIVLFLDDDFLVAPGYVQAVLQAMQSDPAIVAATGTLIADDVKGPGLTVAQGLALIERAGAPADHGFDTAPHGYGCNMAINLDTARAHNLRFDERLPLYAWSEDIDFTHRIGRYGRIVKLRGARGVHLGVKAGRSPGRRLGYSQVANPLYLRRKGTITGKLALHYGARNVLANLRRAIRPEPFVDRRGRLLGNCLAFLDLCRGRLQPERILDF